MSHSCVVNLHLRAMSVIVAVMAFWATSHPHGFSITRWSIRSRSTRGASKRSKRLIGFETDKSLSGSYHSLMKIWIEPRYASAVFTHGDSSRSASHE